MSEPTVVRTELISPEPSEALANMLGTDLPVEALPPLWHWVHLLDRRPQSDLGPDGHPRFGIPATPGPGQRRMFAGGRVSTHAAPTTLTGSTTTTAGFARRVMATSSCTGPCRR